jgi:hypothetical protein
LKYRLSTEKVSLIQHRQSQYLDIIITWSIWVASRQNQHSVFATSMDPDQPAHPCSLIRIHAVR